MTQIDKYVCNQCKKEVKNHYEEKGWIIIEGRISVSKGIYAEGCYQSNYFEKADRDFCSIGCLVKFLEIKEENQKCWYFIDIDGCIMPSIFPNTFYKNDIEKLQMIREAYNNAIHLTYENFKIQTRSFESVLYPNFVEFYKEISKKKPIITFITGRQKNIFGWLTQYQLQLLNKINANYSIWYFPDDLKHTRETYNDFKVDIILSEMDWSKSENIVKIYDDNSDYFEPLKDKDNLLGYRSKISCYLAKSNDDWLQILKELQQEVK